MKRHNSEFKIKFFIFFLMYIFADSAKCQIGNTIPASRRVDWTNVGYHGTFPKVVKNTINVNSLGIKGDGKTDGSKILQAAIEAANSSVWTLFYFPAGDYILNSPIAITKDKIVLRGAGSDSTRLHFWNQHGQCLYITGKWHNELKSMTEHKLVSGNQKDSKRLTLAAIPTNIDSGTYIDLQRDMYMRDICNLPTASKECITNSYAFEQIIKVNGRSGTTLQLEDGLSLSYDLSTMKINRINMVQDIGVEDMNLIKESNDPQHDSSAYKIYIESAANIWISGIESSYTAFHHIGIVKSTHVEVRGSYFHHAYNYYNDKLGRTIGYGVYIGFGSTDCLVEDNIFVKLRHSFVLSVSPNRNVIGYNYSAEPYACLKGNCQSEMVVHGYYPQANLFEGNISGYFDIDSYWGYNGPYNTVFRNKFDKIDLCSAPNMNVVGNLINTYQKLGCPDPSDIFKRNNNESEILTDKSYYHTSKPGFISESYTWPVMGPPISLGQSLTNTIPAERRYESGKNLTVRY